MINLVNSIVNRNFVEADSIIEEAVELIMKNKLEEAKKVTASKMCEQGLNKPSWALQQRGLVEKKEKEKEKEDDDQEDDNEENGEQIDEARIKIIKARIRGGKIQRRKKVSNVAGMTLRGGKLQRMSPAERRRRKMGAKKAKIKRRSKMSRTLMKRQRSIRKRKALGL